MSQEFSAEEASEILNRIRTKMIKAGVEAAAGKKNVHKDAYDLVVERANAAFNLNANGDLRGPNGLTCEGWVTFVLPTEAPFLFDGHNAPSDIETEKTKAFPPTKASNHRESARERLDRANGAPPTAGFE